MLDRALTDSPWIALATWVVLYVSDYYLTLWGAQLYKDTASRFLDMGGSYELEPLFQKDIDALRRFSPDFLWYLLLSSLVLLFMWWLTVQHLGIPSLFLVVLGAFLLVELVIHIRHRRNISMFRGLRRPDAAQGRLKYQRSVLERQSAVELTSFGFLFALCYLLSSHPIFIGGALGCINEALRHNRYARRKRP